MHARCMRTCIHACVDQRMRASTDTCIQRTKAYSSLCMHASTDTSTHLPACVHDACTQTWHGIVCLNLRKHASSYASGAVIHRCIGALQCRLAKLPSLGGVHANLIQTSCQAQLPCAILHSLQNIQDNRPPGTSWSTHGARTMNPCAC